ncbi:MAG TPA: alpha/beta fold hydrolase [Actinocrinis sp.]|nr:alpha/beta fold hydrolase [Actinocrinis sp.]
MPRCQANGIEIEYDTFGEPADPALLLVMGLGMQLTAWLPDFCERLAGHGFHVIRFDNRDIGLSTAFDDGPQPDVMAILGGDTSSVPYLLEDLAADTIGLLDHLGISVAHVLGVSMGGMITQELITRYPDRFASACSIMSTTGEPSVGQPSPEASAALLSPPAVDRDGAIERGLAIQRILMSPAYPQPDELLRARVAAGYDRSYRPAGTVRQLAAIVASGDRTEALHSVAIPTVVIHGDADPLVNVSGGRATAAAIPGAQLIVLPGMGHDLPVELWDTIIDAAAANAKAA